MKALAKQLSHAAKVLRSFRCEVLPRRKSGPVTIWVEKGEAVYLRKEKS